MYVHTYILLILTQFICNSRILVLHPWIRKSFSRSPEHFFLTVSQNNFGNKIPILSPRMRKKKRDCYCFATLDIFLTLTMLLWSASFWVSRIWTATVTGICADRFLKIYFLSLNKLFTVLILEFDVKNWLWKCNFGTFWWTIIHRRIKKNPLSMLILGQKSCFLGPTIFKIPQPNSH